MCGECCSKTHKTVDCPITNSVTISKQEWKRIGWARKLANEWYKERHDTSWDDMAERLVKIRKHLK